MKSMLCGLLCLVLLNGCSDPVALPPDDFVLPAPDMSLDTARLEGGEVIAFRCGPRGTVADPLRIFGFDEWILVDIFFSSQAPRETRPTPEQLGWVRDARGRVLYEFNIPAVRARVIASRIPDLFKQNRLLWVRAVPNAARYDIEVHVTFTRPATADDVDLFQRLGGRVERVLTIVPMLTGTIPDVSIPHLREHPSVTSLYPESLTCALAMQ